MQVSYYILLIATVLLSGSTVLFFTIKGKNLKLILSFSGAFLFAISILHLLPETYANGGMNIGVFILAGFFLQIFFEFFSEGIEHGHIHVHHDHTHKPKIPYAVLAGLFIHSFLEGMPLAESQSTPAQTNLLLGITLHNIPISIALMSMLIQSHIKKSTAFICLALFALITPIGTFSSQMIAQNMIGNITLYKEYIMAMVIGIFLHISTTILFESSENHRFNLIKFGTIIAGAGLAFLIH